MERGLDAKEWLVGLSTKLKETRRFGKLQTVSITGLDENERVVVAFPNWLVTSRIPYQEVAASLMTTLVERKKKQKEKENKKSKNAGFLSSSGS